MTENSGTEEKQRQFALLLWIQAPVKLNASTSIEFAFGFGISDRLPLSFSGCLLACIFCSIPFQIYESHPRWSDRICTFRWILASKWKFNAWKALNEIQKERNEIEWIYSAEATTNINTVQCTKAVWAISFKRRRRRRRPCDGNSNCNRSIQFHIKRQICNRALMSRATTIHSCRNTLTALNECTHAKLVSIDVSSGERVYSGERTRARWGTNKRDANSLSSRSLSRKHY